MGSKCKVLYLMSSDDEVARKYDQSLTENKVGGHPNIEGRRFELDFWTIKKERSVKLAFSVNNTAEARKVHKMVAVQK